MLAIADQTAQRTFFSGNPWLLGKKNNNYLQKSTFFSSKIIFLKFEFGLRERTPKTSAIITFYQSEELND